MIERHEGQIKTNEPAPENCLADTLVQLEAERLREPERISCESSKEHASDDHIMEMRHEKQAIVQDEIRRRNCKQHACHAANDKSYHEAQRPIDRRVEAETASI